MYLLDTNVLSELRKTRPHGGVTAWLNTVDARDLYVSAVSLGEIQAGIEITREQDSAKATEIESWADELPMSWNILPMDTIAFRLWARLMHRRSDSLTNDAMIAATALVHGLVVATRNVRDFKGLGVDTIDPYIIR